MTPLGWIFLLVSITFVWGLTGWCFYRVLSFHDEGFVQPPPAGAQGEGVARQTQVPRPPTDPPSGGDRRVGA